MISKKNEIIEAILGAKRIGLLTHKDGDGDAFGSMIGLGMALSPLGKEIIYFSNEKLNRIFEFLGEKIEYRPKEEYEKTDLLIGLDANSVKRFTLPEVLEKGKEDGTKIAIIDHHLNGDIDNFADIYWKANEESCTAEMIFDLVTEMKIEIDKIVSTIILLGIETDTLSMQIEDTKPRTFEVVAELLRKGARLKPIVDNAFGGKPISTVKILGRVMNRLELDASTGLATSYITLKDTQELGLETEASSGVANFLEQVEGAKIIAVFEEREGGKVKVSLRSNNSEADVERIASSLGGGGHKKAAGFEITGKIENAREAVKNSLS